jgi:hypothetical protein
VFRIRDVTDNDSPSALLQSSARSARLADGYEPRTSLARSGEHRLMLAILEDAVAIFVKSLSGARVKLSEARSAQAWLESRDRSLPFTFECVCDQLGFDSGYIRRGLRVLHTTPAAATARFAGRNYGRPPGCLPRRPGPRLAPRVVVVMDIALADGTSLAPVGGERLSLPPAPTAQASAR